MQYIAFPSIAPTCGGRARGSMAGWPLYTGKVISTMLSSVLVSQHAVQLLPLTLTQLPLGPLDLKANPQVALLPGVLADGHALILY